MSRHPRCLEAAPLVDADVHDDRPRLHGPHQLPRDQPRGARARHEDGADHQIGASDLLLDDHLVAHEGLHSGEVAFGFDQAFDPDVEQRDTRMHAQGDLSCVRARGAGAQAPPPWQRRRRAPLPGACPYRRSSAGGNRLPLSVPTAPPPHSWVSGGAARPAPSPRSHRRHNSPHSRSAPASAPGWAPDAGR